ncbi:hypothetical protein [Kitasatospora sp. Ki12]
MTLSDLARRLPPVPAPDAKDCPGCEWLDGLADGAFNDPEGCDRSALTDVRVLRARHEAAGECLAVSRD